MSLQYGGQLCVFCHRMFERCKCKRTTSVSLTSRSRRIDECCASLQQMGFPEEQARRAAELSSGIIEAASELILDNMARAPSPPRARASSSSSSPTSPRKATSPPSIYASPPTRPPSRSIPISGPPPKPTSSSRSSPHSPHYPPAPSPAPFPAAHHYTSAAHHYSITSLPRLTLPPSAPRSSQHSLSSSSHSSLPSSLPPSSRPVPSTLPPSVSSTVSPRDAVSISDSSSSSSSSPSKGKSQRPLYGFTAPDVFSRLSPPSMSVVDSNLMEPSQMSLDGEDDDVETVKGNEEEVRIHIHDDTRTLHSTHTRGMSLTQKMSISHDPRVLDVLRDDVQMDMVMRSPSGMSQVTERFATPSPSFYSPSPTPTRRESLQAEPLVRDERPNTRQGRPAKVPSSPPAMLAYAHLPPPPSVSTLPTSDLLYSQFCQLALWLHPHEIRPNLAVDCQDYCQKWLPAVLLRVHTDYQPSAPHQTSFCTARVHYQGWHAKWDERLDLLASASRVARYEQFSVPSPGFAAPPWAQIGCEVVVWWDKGKRGGVWLDGEVFKVDGHQVLIVIKPTSTDRRRWYLLESDHIMSKADYHRRDDARREALLREEREMRRRQEDEERRLKDEREAAADAATLAYRRRMAAEVEAERTLTARRTSATASFASPRYTDPLPGASLSAIDRRLSSPIVKAEPRGDLTQASLASLSSLSHSASLSASSPSTPRSSSQSLSAPAGPTAACPYWTGQFVEVEDTAQKWLPAEILDVSLPQQLVYIHYEGWHEKWDEWLPFSSSRIRPLGSTLQDSAEERARKAQEAAFRSLLSTLPYKLVEEEKDGNCLFRSVARQLWGDAGLHRRVRAECCDWIEREGEFFRQFVGEDIGEYVKVKRRGEEWGDHVEIEAMKELYDVNIVVYDKRQVKEEGKRGQGEGKEGEDDDGKEGQEAIELDVKGEELDGVDATLRLSYHGKNHFNSLLDPRRPFPLRVKREEGVEVQASGKWKARRVEKERFATEAGKGKEEMKEDRAATPSAGFAGPHEQQLILLGHANYVQRH